MKTSRWMKLVSSAIAVVFLVTTIAESSPDLSVSRDTLSALQKTEMVSQPIMAEVSRQISPEDIGSDPIGTILAEPVIIVQPSRSITAAQEGVPKYGWRAVIENGKKNFRLFVMLILVLIMNFNPMYGQKKDTSSRLKTEIAVGELKQVSKDSLAGIMDQGETVEKIGNKYVVGTYADKQQAQRIMNLVAVYVPETKISMEKNDKGYVLLADFFIDADRYEEILDAFGEFGPLSSENLWHTIMKESQGRPRFSEKGAGGLTQLMSIAIKDIIVKIKNLSVMTAQMQKRENTMRELSAEAAALPAGSDERIAIESEMKSLTHLINKQKNEITIFKLVMHLIKDENHRSSAFDPTKAADLTLLQDTSFTDRLTLLGKSNNVMNMAFGFAYKCLLYYQLEYWKAEGVIDPNVNLYAATEVAYNKGLGTINNWKNWEKLIYNCDRETRRYLWEYCVFNAEVSGKSRIVVHQDEVVNKKIVTYLLVQTKMDAADARRRQIKNSPTFVLECEVIVKFLSNFRKYDRTERFTKDSKGRKTTIFMNSVNKYTTKAMPDYSSLENNLTWTKGLNGFQDELYSQYGDYVGFKEKQAVSAKRVHRMTVLRKKVEGALKDVFRIVGFDNIGIKGFLGILSGGLLSLLVHWLKRLIKRHHVARAGVKELPHVGLKNDSYALRGSEMSIAGVTMSYFRGAHKWNRMIEVRSEAMNVIEGVAGFVWIVAAVLGVPLIAHVVFAGIIVVTFAGRILFAKAAERNDMRILVWSIICNTIRGVVMAGLFVTVEAVNFFIIKPLLGITGAGTDAIVPSVRGKYGSFNFYFRFGALLTAAAVCSAVGFLAFHLAPVVALVFVFVLAATGYGIQLLYRNPKDIFKCSTVELIGVTILTMTPFNDLLSKDLLAGVTLGVVSAFLLRLIELITQKASASYARPGVASAGQTMIRREAAAEMLLIGLSDDYISMETQQRGAVAVQGYERNDIDPRGDIVCERRFYRAA